MLGGSAVSALAAGLWEGMTASRTAGDGGCSDGPPEGARFLSENLVLARGSRPRRYIRGRREQRRQGREGGASSSHLIVRPKCSSVFWPSPRKGGVVCPALRLPQIATGWLFIFVREEFKISFMDQ